MNLRDYITIKTESSGSEACIAGTSVAVSSILEKLAEGLDVDEITHTFPTVSRDAIKAAVLYASELAKNTRPGHEELLADFSKEDVLQILGDHKATIIERFGIRDLALFGSYARGQAIAGSDVDILVSFDGPATSKAFFGLQSYLESLLHRRVDLVTQKALRPDFRPQVEREAVYV